MDVSGASAKLMCQLAAAPTSPRAARAIVRQSAQSAGVDAGLIADLELAVSELVTNGVVHGVGGTVQVHFDPHPPVVLAVTSGIHPPDARPVGPPSTWFAPRPEQTSGRGLYLVSRLASEVDVAYADSAVTVRCVFRPHP